MEVPEGSENVQAATGQGEIEPLAPVQPGDTGQPAPGTTEGTPAEGTVEEPQKGPIPFERFDEVNRAKNEAEQRAMQLQQMLLQQQQLQMQPQGPQADPFQQFLQQEGIGADGFVSVEDLTKVNAYFQRQSAQQLQQTQQEQWLASHPDYVGVVTTPTGQMSEHLLKAIQADPALGVRLRQNWDPVIAYHVARAAMANTAAPNTPKPNMVNQIKAGQAAPQGISAAAGTGGQVDRVTAISSMSDDEFSKAWRSGQFRGVGS